MENHASEQFLDSLRITIENPKGSYKSFETEGDTVWERYPLKGVIYPTDYGSIAGFSGEDGADLDVFVGTGEKCGFIRVSRLDVPAETKFFIRCGDEEVTAIKAAFAPVLLDAKVLNLAELKAEMIKFQI